MRRLELFNLSSVRGPTMQTDVGWLVPAPRLELQSGRAGPDADLVHHLMNLAPDLLSELKRGRFETTKEMLEIFVELSVKFSNFENKILENSGQATKGSPRKRVDPLTNPLKLEVTL